MKKLLGLLFLLTLPTAYTLDLEWHVPEAEYRLIVESDRPGENGYFDFGDYAMPILLGKGVDIRDHADNKIPFYLHQTLGLVIAPAPGSPRRYIYFGLPEVSPVDQWNKAQNGEIPPDRTIYTNAYWRGHRYWTSKEWLDNQVNNLENRFIRDNGWNFKYLLRCFATSAVSLHQEVLDPRAEPVTVGDWNKPLDRENYLCWRYRDLSRRINYFSQEEMERSYADPFRYSRARMDWVWRRIYLSRKNIFRVLPDLQARAPEAPMNDFINIFKQPYRGVFFSANQALFHITDDAFDSRRNIAVVMEGKLIVPENGEYEFKAEANGSFLLYVDGQLHLSKYNEPVIDKFLKLNLTAGLHEVRFCFQRQSSSIATLSWKKTGAEQFAVLTENDFAPAWPNPPLAMQRKPYVDIPLIKQISQYDIFIAKTEKKLWKELAAVNGPQITWLLNGAPVFIGEKATLISNPGDQFGIMTDDFPPTRFFWLRADRKDKPWFHADLSLNLFVPDFIYEDEELEMFVEMLSALPVAARSVLSVTPDRKNPMFQTGKREIIVPPKRMIQEDRYASDGSFKYSVHLKGAELKNALNIDFELKVPELIFSSRKLRFIPLNTLPPLTLDANGDFRDEQNALVVPVLHRPALSEIRTWELPAKIKNQIVSYRHMLLIGDDFGNFSADLENTLKQKSLALTFLPWSRDHQPLLRMRRDLPRMLQDISRSQADLALVIPAAADVADQIPLRSQSRHLAAILQALRANKNIQTICLATPLPMENHAELEQKLSQELRKLGRDYGVRIIDLNHFLRQNGELNYAPDAAHPAYRERLPVGNTSAISRLIVSETVR